MSKDKRLTAAELTARDTMAIMGDEDSVTGFLIAGRCAARRSRATAPSPVLLVVFVWQLAFDALCFDPRLFSPGIGQGAGGKGTNFYICDKSTTNQREVEKAFLEFTEARKDIAILLITQGVAQHIRHLVDAHTAPVSRFFHGRFRVHYCFRLFVLTPPRLF